jgi:lipoprotein-anchoring transpeptidase ErfK/SrfK
MSLVATATVPVVSVYDDPTASAPSRQLENPWLVDPAVPATAVPQVFLAKETRPDGWVRVLLPVRPNGSSGWVRTSEVSLAPNPYNINVERGAHRITVTNADSIVYQGAVAVGLPETPTPLGEYYLRVLIQAPDPGQVYGPFAYGLSSHSDVLVTFNGGDGEIGIHGNDDASALGRDASHGCIRMDNAAITMLAGLLPLGTPVEIVA